MAVGNGGGPPVFIPSNIPGLGYGGAEYGYSPYGSAALPRPPYAPGGGYGGAPYGLGPYGSLDTTPPRVTGAISLDGFRVEVFFSEEMLVDTVFCDPTNYVFTKIIGAPVTAVSVVVGVMGTHGATSAIITHTGTTLGGQYILTVTNVTDLQGNAIDDLPTNSAQFFTFGYTPTFTANPIDGSTLQLTFDQDLLEESVFSPGVEDLNAYGLTTSYPVPLTLLSVTHPVSSNLAVVDLEVQGMTSAEYAIEVSPSDAITYDATVLPDVDPNFTGVEIGTGTSVIGTVNSKSALLLSKTSGNLYGWSFGDTSGRLLPNSTYRVDFTFDVSATVISPALFDAVFGTLIVSDGAIQISISLTRIAGVFALDITSGALSQTVLADWSLSETTLTLLRNQQADHYAILLNGIPVYAANTASFTGVPSISVGAQFTLSTNYSITQFPVFDLNFTATQTVFSHSWNFLHGVSNTVTGSSQNTKNFILTERGPLVKGWGDATPATKQDVAVKVNGIDVTISKVNPFAGKIFPEIPIPLMPMGTMTVETDYTWFPNPAMELSGLNTEGLVLNKWDRASGHTPPPRPPLTNGVADTQRFPFGIVLGPKVNDKPILISHRYLGFEKLYTASLNSPTTLLLNQNPHSISKPGFKRSLESDSVEYDGTTTPQNAIDNWSLTGVDTGALVGDGTYRVIDASSGSFGLGTAAVYHRDIDLSFPALAIEAVRFFVSDWTLNGIFTGVGFGLHDNNRLYLLGCLLINDVKHVGLLTNPSCPDIQESWQIGPAISITITGDDTFEFPASELPTFIEDGTRFQILDGPQSGVYTIATCGLFEEDGIIEGIIEETFPEDPSKYDNAHATIYLEVLWDQTNTFRAIVDPDTRGGEFFVGGSLSGSIGTLNNAPSFPADTSLLLPTGEFGSAFWGSVSRLATNDSTWSFVRYDITPDQVTQTTTGIIVAAEMSDPPEEDSNNEWFFLNEFGTRDIVSGDTLLLKSTSASDSINLTYGYGRIEAFLQPTVAIDVDATFLVDSGTLGAGDAQILIRDTNREILFSTLLYMEGGTPYRQLLNNPNVSLSGLFSPEDQGWETSVGSGNTTFVQGNKLTVSQGLGFEGNWSTNLETEITTPGGRIIEARLKFVSWTANATGKTGAYFGAHVGNLAPARQIRIAFQDAIGATPQQVYLASDLNTPLASFNFNWGDGEYHSYRVLVDPTTASGTLIIDDVVIGTFDPTLFANASNDTLVEIGTHGTDIISIVEWDSFSVIALPPITAKRTLGLFLGGDINDINNWKIPRTDTLDVLNSDAAAIIEEMDWQSEIQVRVRKDPRWGALVYRPDLPPPPYYDGDFATSITEPSAAWINVETQHLPRKKQSLGQVQFGALDKRSISQQRWNEVRYRIYTNDTEDFISAHHMVLNQYNVISSGELNIDVTPEVVELNSVTDTLISLRPTHIYADRIFNVVVDNIVLSPLDFTFDSEKQLITLTNPLPAAQYPVTVTFAAGKPVTNTYLCSQPLLNGVTLLNEGTPPVPKSQVSTATKEIVFGSQLNDPNNTLGVPDFILNDPYRTVQFTNDPDCLYEDLEFCEVTDDGSTGLISIACDGKAPEEGWIELGLDGYNDQFTVTGGPGTWPGSPVIKGTTSSFPQASILHASGGHFVNGVLGPGTAVLYPNAGAALVKAGTVSGGLNQEIQYHLTLDSVVTPGGDVPLEETFSSASDNTPPSSALPIDNNPNGTPSATGNGALAANLEDGVGLYSRLGPWGGLNSLEPESLLAGGSTSQPTGYPPSGVGFTTVGGSPLNSPTQTPFTIEAAN